MRLPQEKIQKYRSIIGAHFITAPWSFMWVYGNLAEYMASYVRFSCSPACYDADNEWILPIYVASFCPGLFLVRLLMSKIGLRGTGIAIMTITGVSLLASAWAIGVSVMWTVMMMGILNGFCVSITVCIAYLYIHGWAPENAAILMASISCTPNLVSILQNQIITAIVNPTNLKPDVQEDHKMYFSQPEVLERVPKAILVQGIMTVCLQAVGYLLVSTPPTNSAANPSSVDGNKKLSIKQSSKNRVSDTHLRIKSETTELLEIKAQQSNGDSRKIYPSVVESNCGKNLATLQDQSKSTKSSVGTFKANVETNEAKCKQCGPESQNPSQVVKTAVFWTLWLSWCALSYGLLLHSDTYKQFGLVFIPDDKFLTFLGSLIPFTTSTARIVFGLLIDKHILSIKDSLVLALATNVLLCSIWYFTPQIHKLMYLIFILSQASALGMYYVVFPAAAMRIFGPVHFSTILGLLYSAQTVSGLATALLVTPLVQVFGWFWLFISCSSLSFLALIITLTTEIVA